MILPSTDQELRGILHRLGDAVLDYQRLQGFLFAIACSPEVIKPSEWFELIWLDDEPQFDDEEEAKRFLALLAQGMAELEQGLDEGRLLPFFCPTSQAERHKLGMWCEGFLMAHQYLEELWEVALMDIESEAIDDAVTAVLNLASAFTEVLIADQLHFEEGFNSDEPLEDEQENTQLEEAYQWFDEVLSVYADVRGQWQEFNATHDVGQLFLDLEAVGRDEPCPCGSGEVFSKCCLH